MAVALKKAPTGNRQSRRASNSNASAPRGARAQRRVAFTQFGATGLRNFAGYVREEWEQDLIGRKGMLKIREMADNDTVIAAILFAIEMLLRGVPFHMEPADATNPDDIDAANFVQSCLADMEIDFASLIAEQLSFLKYGYCVHELVYKFRRGDDPDPRYNSQYDDGMIGWRKIAIRAQETLLHWTFDPAGDATQMVQMLPTGGPLLSVPLTKCIHIRTTPYKGNPEGRSILRSMYTSYYFKKMIQEIEAIGVARDLAGIPIIYVPPEWTTPDASDGDKASYEAVKDMITSISRNEQEGIVLPMMFAKDGKTQTLKLELLTSAGRRQFPTTEIIDRYNHMIAAAVLADFITLGQGASGGRGSFAQSKNKTDMFSAAVVAFLDMITSGWNRKAVPDLLSLNNMKGRCRLAHGDISRRDLQDIGTYVLDLAQAGIITPDPNLEAHLREEGGLPPPPDADGSGADLSSGGNAGGGGGDDDPSDDPHDAPDDSEGQGAGALAWDNKPVGYGNVSTKRRRARTREPVRKSKKFVVKRRATR